VLHVGSCIKNCPFPLVHSQGGGVVQSRGGILYCKVHHMFDDTAPLSGCICVCGALPRCPVCVVAWGISIAKVPNWDCGFAGLSGCEVDIAVNRVLRLRYATHR
jgi:hypothetical protein